MLTPFCKRYVMKRDAPKAWGNESLHHHYLREAAGGRFAQADGKLCEMAFCHPHRRTGCVDDGSSTDRAVASSSGSRRRRNPPRRAHVPDQREGYHRLL